MLFCAEGIRDNLFDQRHQRSIVRQLLWDG